MTFLLLKLMALSMVAHSSGAHAHDEPSALLRGSQLQINNFDKASESFDMLHEFEQIEASECTATGALASNKRAGMTKGQVCRRDFGYAGQVEPYSCSSAPGYACCKSTTAKKVNIPNVGKCSKKSSDSEEEEENMTDAEEEEDMTDAEEEESDSVNEFEQIEASECTATGALAANERGSMTKGQVCRRDFGYARQVEPYSCSSAPGYACCKSTTAKKVNIPNVGKCSKKSSDSEEEEEDMTDAEEESDSVNEFEQIGAAECTATGALASNKRAGMTKGQVCRRDYGYAGQVEPYSCSSAPGYACCKSTTAKKVNIPNVGKCSKKKSSDSEEEVISVA